MNTANAAPDSNSNSQSQQAPMGEVIPLPITDYKVHPMTKEAHDIYYSHINEYTDPTGRQQMECRRHYINLPAIKDLAQALERQVTVEEMNLLIGLDGEPVTCKVTERKFQPVWWVLLTDELLRSIKFAKGVSEDSLRSGRAMKVGMFFPNPDITVEEVYPVAGVPFFWTKTEEAKRAFWSPLCKMWEVNRKQYGDTREVADGVIEGRKNLKAEKAKVNQGMNRMAEIFMKPGDRRDRRTFSPKK